MIGLHVYISLSLQIQKVDITCMRHQDRCSSKTKSNMFLYCFCKSSTDKGYTNVSTSKQDSCIYIFNPICMLFFFLQKTDAPLEQVKHCIESVCKEEEVFTFLKADDKSVVSSPGYGSGCFLGQRSNIQKPDYWLYVHLLLLYTLLMEVVIY